MSRLRRPRPGLRTSRGSRSAAEVVEDARWRGSTAYLVSAVASKAALLDAVAGALAFPPWVGRNWDALADALGDLSWQPAGPHELVWAAPERLREADPAAYRTAVEVLRAAADGSAGSERPLTVLLVPDRKPPPWT